MLSKRPYHSAHLEENIKPNYDSSNFAFLFHVKIIVNGLLSYILVTVLS